MITKNIIKHIKNRIWIRVLGASSVLLGFMLGIVMFGLVVPGTTNADLPSSLPVPVLSLPKIINNGKLTVCKIDRSAYEVVKKVKMVVTAYTSRPEETDDTPFITASNKRVADGILANNMLPFGTKVRIPELYGDKVFTVEDRMNKRMGNYRADIWMAEYKDAKNFGAKSVYIEVLEN